MFFVTFLSFFFFMGMAADATGPFDGQVWMFAMTRKLLYYIFVLRVSLICNPPPPPPPPSRSNDCDWTAPTTLIKVVLQFVFFFVFVLFLLYQMNHTAMLWMLSRADCRSRLVVIVVDSLAGGVVSLSPVAVWLSATLSVPNTVCSLVWIVKVHVPL